MDKPTTHQVAKQATTVTRESAVYDRDGVWLRLYFDLHREDTGKVVSATAITITDEHGNDLRRISGHVLLSHYADEPRIETRPNGDCVMYSGSTITYY